MLEAIAPRSWLDEQNGSRIDRAMRLFNRQCRLTGGEPPVTAGLRVVEVRRPEDLAPHEPAWEDLARDAVEPNAFYEPWLLRPAWEHLGGDGVRVLLLYDDAGPAPRLCGLFPLRWVTLPLGLRLLKLWKYHHCFLCAPLVRPGWEGACWRRILAWANAGSPGGWVWRLDTIPAEGRLWEGLRETLARLGRPWVVRQVYERAFARWRAGDGSGVLSNSANRRKKLGQQDRRLRALGEFAFRELGPEEDPGEWTRAFLDLERSGWKGGDGGWALAKDPRTAAFFAAACRAGHRRGRLRMVGAYLGDRPIAMVCDFYTGGGVFCFKNAYDEAFAPYSPGILLEVECFRRLLADPARSWLDSCHDAGTGTLRRFLSQTRVLHDVLITGRGGLSAAAVSAWSLIRWGKRQLRRVGRRPAASGERMPPA